MSNQQDVVKELNQQVANWTVAYTKLHKATQFPLVCERA